MSSVEESCQLKAGHPPAVKVSGMRIANLKTKEGEKEVNKASSKENNSGSSSTMPPSPLKMQSILFSTSSVIKNDSDFPPEAVKAFHEKPTPSHEFRPAHQRQNIIMQPRK
ncbi:death-associated protein 1-like [Brevipalpus obovatus]|uniref:death-associated protein 1-like n=1 Tax=Brevipalpus obovatus TaxID=246614 RepID=UPI003D9DBD2C